jgi:hypothetical protein
VSFVTSWQQTKKAGKYFSRFLVISPPLDHLVVGEVHQRLDLAPQALGQER